MSTADRPEPDDLVIRAALGEPLDTHERERLANDPALQAEVDEFAHIVAVAADPPEGEAPALDHLWEGIAAEAFGDTQQEPAGDVGDAGDVDEGSGQGRVVQLRPPTRWMPIAAMGAAAAALVAVVFVAVGPPSADPAPVAAASLEPLGEVSVDPVTAQFVVADGSHRLQVDLSALPDAPDGFYELWLLDPEDGRMVSLGPARPDGAYALPDGVAVDDYPAVDVSVEPHDGDPTHSGDSVLRGSVTT